ATCVTTPDGVPGQTMCRTSHCGEACKSVPRTDARLRERSNGDSLTSYSGSRRAVRVRRSATCAEACLPRVVPRDGPFVHEARRVRQVPDLEQRSQPHRVRRGPRAPGLYEHEVHMEARIDA